LLRVLVKEEYDRETCQIRQAWGSQVSPHLFRTYSHSSSISFWKSAITALPMSPFSRCLKRPWGLRNSSAGTYFLGL